MYDSLDKVWLEAVLGSPDQADKFCSDWEAGVRAAVPPGQLLEFQASQGWPPLVKFLGLTQPDTPFPRLNSRQHLQQVHDRCILVQSSD